jgi:hypothetical protein
VQRLSNHHSGGLEPVGTLAHNRGWERVMHLSGYSLPKLVTCLAAVMTVAAGTPNRVCRCPDGRLMHFCPGFLVGPSGCCCSTAGCCDRCPFAGPSDTGRSCCLHRQAEHSGFGHEARSKPIVTGATCVRSMSAEFVDGRADEAERYRARWNVSPFADGLTSADPDLVPPVRAAHPEKRFHQAPPDLYILLCHFTN